MGRGPVFNRRYWRWHMERSWLVRCSSIQVLATFRALVPVLPETQGHPCWARVLLGQPYLFLPKLIWIELGVGGQFLTKRILKILYPWFFIITSFTASTVKGPKGETKATHFLVIFLFDITAAFGYWLLSPSWNTSLTWKFPHSPYSPLLLLVHPSPRRHPSLPIP